MIETDDLILDKAVFEDWRGIYQNVWSRPESARYMLWKVTESESEARIRIRKTMEFQKNHDTYLVYEKESGEPIGFAGVEKLSDHVYQEAEEFYYSTREENKASVGLARSLGFECISSEVKVDGRDGHSYHLLKYRLKLKK